MTIIYIYRSLAVYGGIERIFIDKINYLSEKAGHNVFIITYEQGNHPIVFPLSPKATHIDLDVPFYLQYQYNIVKRMAMHRRMEKLFQKRLAEQVEKIKPDIMIAATCEFSSIKALMNLKDHSKKVIETHAAKAGIEKATSSSGNAILNFLYKRMNNKLFDYVKKSSALVTITNGDAKEWEQIKKAHIIPNILTYYPPTTQNALKTKKRVISAGRLTDQKGFDLLIDSWKKVHDKHPEWKLDIFGDGEDKNMLQQKIVNLQLSNCITIHPPTPKIYDEYMNSDFYVMSSRWEGFGLVLAEAMSCGIPCVSFDCPYGPGDIIKNKEDGLLVENKNTEKLAENISYLIENENIRLEMGKKARKNIKRYLPENIMPQWESLFQSLIKGK